MKSPMTMIVQAVGMIATPLVLGEMVARLFGRGAWYDLQATGFVLSLTYATIAIYLLFHRELLVTRIRLSLILSLVVIAGVWIAALVLPMVGNAVPLLMNLVVYGVMASVPLVLVGLHNLSWSLQQIRDQL